MVESRPRPYSLTGSGKKCLKCAEAPYLDLLYQNKRGGRGDTIRSKRTKEELLVYAEGWLDGSTAVGFQVKKARQEDNDDL